MRKEVRFAGFGGQGVILSAFILGRAVSVHTPMHATMTQSYGPESRGGSCEADVVVGDAEIDTPMVTRPDILDPPISRGGDQAHGGGEGGVPRP